MLRGERSRLRTLFEETLNPILITDEDGNCVDANGAALRFLECTREELRGRKVWDFKPPEQLDEVGTKHTSFENRRTHEANYRVGGKIKILLLDVVPINAEGKTFLYGIGTDITDRKQREESLREEHLFNTSVIQKAAEGLCVCHEIAEYPHLRFTVWNDRMVQITGYTMDEINRSDWYRTVCSEPEVWKRAAERMIEMKRGQDLYTEEWKITRSDGEKRVLSISTSVLKDKKDVLHVLALMSDITERKRIEEEKKKIELHAGKMEAISTLAGGIAHDFNNLLQVVQGYAELLLMARNKEDPECMKICQISRAAKKGAELTRQLLTFSRRIDTNLYPVDLNYEVKQTSRILERTLPKTIAIQLSLEDHLFPVKADSAQITQALINLAMNARDAMPQGGTLTVETRNVVLNGKSQQLHPETAVGDYVLLQVSDTGFGMDEKTVEQVFDPFFTTKEVGKGTGLGLAMVYGIVGNHGGHITCSSKPGEGTIFRIFLPAMTHNHNSFEKTEEEKELKIREFFYKN